MLDAGEKIVQQTRGYDDAKDITLAQRDKEEAHDYRFFPCPDLPPFSVTDDQLVALKAQMPVLPHAQEATFLAKGLSIQDARGLAEEKAFADYFTLLMQETAATKAAANWMLGPVKKWLNEQHADILQFPVKPGKLAGLINLVESGKVNFSVAASSILPKMAEQPEEDALKIATALNLLQESDSGVLEAWVNEVVAAMPEKVAEYKKGKKGLIGLFVGEVKKKSKGKADPQQTTELIKKMLG
jgi:aspartyl-tRNA(Asn)/glutamyl-tRNA(Gln) amidotransferase subunit B